MRDAAELLLLEAGALRPILEALDAADFAEPTVCTGWSVRDVLAHCGAALVRVVDDDLHGFSPSDNEADVAHRRPWPLEAVLEELFSAYEPAATVIDRAGGLLDGVGLGEWMHGGDVREAVGAPHAYTSEGVELAFDLLLERSAVLHQPVGQSSRSIVASLPILDVTVGKRGARFGGAGDAVGALATDLETFVRLCGGRRPDPQRYVLTGANAADLGLFA